MSEQLNFQMEKNRPSIFEIVKEVLKAKNYFLPISTNY